MKSVFLALTLLHSVTFEEVPPQTSKINWIHNNAQSADRQLPETVGAGCAFLDYDNDGWMDIYFVNSGPSDFLDRKSTRLNSSHSQISYAVFCLKKKKKKKKK